MFFSFSHNHIGMMIHSGFRIQQGKQVIVLQNEFISSETGIQSYPANRDLSNARMPQGTQETI